MTVKKAAKADKVTILILIDGFLQLNNYEVEFDTTGESQSLF